ncbi:uncharacterized protein LOC126841981 [Adelges cooleyi]|uniref:uncharacterized protein LOC126841981 n=1 Tax=Adelges cooleyi TaxID=133065 RepID=UPI0021804B40|nr:uncharacterized protein LOC126841981 [Adelges cooleyi]
MKSAGAVLVVVVALVSYYICQSQCSYVSPNALQRSRRQFSFVQDLYNAWYCRRKQCPNWRCQDDSAVIHGYCCGCPNSLGANVPVLCAEDLKCPLKMTNLCQDYSYMLTCCCTGL